MELRPFRLLLMLPLLWTAVSSAAGDLLPLTISRDQAHRVGLNWVAYLAANSEGWGDSLRPDLLEMNPVVQGDTLLAWHGRIAPAGYIVVSARSELPAVLAYSQTATWPEGEENPFLPFLRQSLAPKVHHLANEIDSSPVGDRIADTRSHQTWPRYLLPTQQFEQELAGNTVSTFEESGPLLSSRWHQDVPFNLECPTVNGQRTWVGCMATATAQLMRHHEWPLWGAGSGSYWWDGDDCDMPPVGEWITTDFELPFDWANMPDQASSDMPTSEVTALSDFSFRIASSLQMDFSTCGSEASIGMVRAALMNNFHYRLGIRDVTRFRYTDQGWFNEIRDDIDRGNPILYTTIIHAMVCDGWRDADGMLQIHLNYGWGGTSDNWYTLDDIETSLNPGAERMLLDIEPDTDVSFPLDVLDFQVLESQSGMDVSWDVPTTGTTILFWPLRSGGPLNCIPLPLTEEPLSGQVAYQFLDDTVTAGEYMYWLKAQRGSEEEIWFGPVMIQATVGVGESEHTTVLRFPAPNPANPRTEVAFTLQENAAAQVRVLDVRGRSVAILVEEELPAGDHVAAWDGRTDEGTTAPSGMYFIQLQALGEQFTRKVVLAR